MIIVGVYIPSRREGRDWNVWKEEKCRELGRKIQVSNNNELQKI